MRRLERGVASVVLPVSDLLPGMATTKVVVDGDRSWLEVGETIVDVRRLETVIVLSFSGLPDVRVRRGKTLRVTW